MATIDQLLREQREYAETVRECMAETLALDLLHIRFIFANTASLSRCIIAIDSSPNGQFLGRYIDVLERRKEDPNWYTLVVNGQRLDPLAACSITAYEAMIADARARGEDFLPDSLALNQHNGHVWTATMLTGEPMPSEGKIWIGSSSGGTKVNFVEHPIGRGGRSFRVRPAVVVGQLA